MICLLFFLTAFLSSRNPFDYHVDHHKNILLASATFTQDNRHVFFSEQDDKTLQITLQEKSPSTLEKAEGLGG